VRNVAQALEVVAFGSIVAGVYLIAGLGVALIAAGVLLAAAAVAVERGVTA
jgi:hypothetical protein